MHAHAKLHEKANHFLNSYPNRNLIYLRVRMVIGSVIKSLYRNVMPYLYIELHKLITFDFPRSILRLYFIKLNEHI